MTPSFHLELAPEGALHEAMRFYDDPAANQNAWAQMPPYYWCAARREGLARRHGAGVEPDRRARPAARCR